MFVPSVTEVLQLVQKLLEGTTEEESGPSKEYCHDKNKLA
jgi:hypothetical protein